MAVSWAAVCGVWLVCTAVRVAQSVLVVTAFNPDEYWQSLEVAHARAFGYGYVTWEWQPDARIRSYAQVLLLELWYGLLKRTGTDTRWMVAYSPRIWQGVLAGVGDAATYALAWRWFGRRAAAWTTLSCVVCWFMGYCVVRTFTNSLECVFTACALACWPYTHLSRHTTTTTTTTTVSADDSGDNSDSSDDEAAGQDAWSQPALALVFVGVGVVFRPTSAIVFVPLGVQTFFGLVRGDSYPPLIAAGKFLVQCVVFGALAVGVSACVDSIGYGEWWTLSARNFLRVNSMNGGAIAKLYGTHPWHWYLSSAWPTLLSALLPVFGYALYRLYATRMRQLQRVAAAEQQQQQQQQQQQPARGSVRSGVWSQRWAALCDARLTLWWCVIAFGTAVYSVMNAHKEFRFILPLLPPALVYCGYALAALERDAQRERAAAQPAAPAPATASAPAARPRDRATDVRRRGTAADTPVPAPAPAPVAPAAAAPAAARGRWSASRVLRWLVWALVVTNAGAWYYLSRWHQSGPISAVEFLAVRMSALPPAAWATRGGVSVDFLMDCHSAPLYAYMHFPEPSPRPTLRTLECAPLLQPDDSPAARAAAAAAGDGEWNPHRDTTASAYRFKHNATRFVSEFYAPPTPDASASASTAAAQAAAGAALALSGREPLPSYVVAFRDARLPLLQPLLTAHYRSEPIASFYHAPADETAVLVFARADRPEL